MCFCGVKDEHASCRIWHNYRHVVYDIISHHQISFVDNEKLLIWIESISQSILLNAQPTKPTNLSWCLAKRECCIMGKSSTGKCLHADMVYTKPSTVTKPTWRRLGLPEPCVQFLVSVRPNCPLMVSGASWIVLKIDCAAQVSVRVCVSVCVCVVCVWVSVCVVCVVCVWCVVCVCVCVWCLVCSV